MERLLTIDELSDKLQVGKSPIYRWVRWDFVPYIKIGRVLRFEEGKVKSWLKQRGCAGSTRMKACEIAGPAVNLGSSQADAARFSRNTRG